MGHAREHWCVSRGDSGYPPMLEDLPRPPGHLNGMGDAEALLGPCVSIVGARRATPYGLSVAEMAGRVAAECGLTVVSGGATGCDCAAARGALRAGGRTVVVSGCGADVVYPQSSRDVYEQALGTGGAVISVEAWGQGPRRWAFPKRNAIIAALSRVLLVTEAGMKSGTMSTASVAAELDRIVYAVPGSIYSRNSSGTNHLISEGARIMPDEHAISVSIALDYGLARVGPCGVRGKTGPVMSALVASPSRPGELAERLNEDVLTLMRTLAEYEARGIVERLPDGRYSPTRAFFLEQNG